MAKRPTAAQIRSKQHQVIRYEYSTSETVTAKDYNVSTKKLRQFKHGNPKRLKSRVLKDPAFKSLFDQDVKKVAKKNKVKLVPKLSRKKYFDIQHRAEKGEEVTVRELRASEYRTVTKVREYVLNEKTGKVSYRPISKRTEQAQRARLRIEERGFPTLTSIQAVSNAYQSGEITASDVRAIVNIWQEEYGFNDDHVDELIEKIGVEDAEQE